MFNKTGQIIKPQYMADKSWRLVLGFGEFTADEMASVFKLIESGNIRVILADENDMQALEKQKLE